MIILITAATSNGMILLKNLYDDDGVNSGCTKNKAVQGTALFFVCGVFLCGNYYFLQSYIEFSDYMVGDS